MNQSAPTKKKRKLSVPELPAHITVDILSRLPVKTLLHSQLVCKHWLSLTSPNPPFARLHLSKSPIALLIRAARPDRRQLRLIDLRLQTLPNSHPKHAQLKLSPNLHFPLLGHRVVNSCNGLLCLYDQSDPVFVCNPVLGEYISIPLSQHMGRYDHTTSAFGFSPKTKKYKVLQLFLKFVSYESETYEAEAEIYTLGEGPWRCLGRVPFHPDSQSFYASLSGALDWFNHSFYASLNGAFHWLTFDRASPDFILMILESGEILMLVNKNALVEYNPKLGSFKNLNIYGIKSEFYAAGHIPSFVPLPDVATGERLTKNCLRPRMSALTRLEITLQKIVDSCCESSSRALPVVPTMEECMAKLSSMPQFSQNNEMRVKCKNLFANSDDRALFMACPDDEKSCSFIMHGIAKGG
ncbi:hypothetical protein RHGRI_009868 [Rhododendron griersonianum]|uniref:F-box domain-containing protein n=1 Tax=Rhododendron griersonianum TaxID=479676 RepID=A0AAV6KH42_9ERIC|nr:hypothetical protein RHGRI_009868 [Rhododendron griersonianum]